MSILLFCGSRWKILLVVITYDVSTLTGAGQKRLRKVAKVCQNYGQRVQNSVFECYVDATQFASLKIELSNIIDPDEDSLRFYQLGNNYKNKVMHIGAKPSLDLEDPLIF
ncbi:CRISPR-associated protein Cas2 [Heyndrickxia coagulans DSM 1 = ATCC 7050]|uniref:CRISPR-associated endoribonuclease Cas2 n=1 Tax=Heyndrickxia coagulans DSM 1 = ATCC 7050 TaxID=1121088 RepID=A0A8B4BYF7_HEYCO|nr:CRISPR-associated protein Cas2 [Heyndrickxia coagulans DSM 1 = ATCC 7050]